MKQISMLVALFAAALPSAAQSRLDCRTHIPAVIMDPTITQIPADGKICQGCVPADTRASDITNFTVVKRNNAPYIQTWNLTTQAQLRALRLRSATWDKRESPSVH